MVNCAVLARARGNSALPDSFAEDTQ